jgi:hypothetical protein
MIRISPQGTPDRPGLTGLETYLWVEGIGIWTPPQTTLEGTQVEVQAWPIEYRWDTGDGTPQPGTRPPSEHTYTVTCPATADPAASLACGGSRERPHAVHVYETKSSIGRPAEGAYTVSVTVVWQARYRVIGPGGPGEWVPLPNRESQATMPYTVVEAKGVLCPLEGCPPTLIR